MKKLRPILFICVLTLVYACKGGEDHVQVPDDVLPPDSMVSILVDFHLVEGVLVYKQQHKEPTEQLSADLYAMILKKHNIDRETFSHALTFYSEHPRVYMKIYNQVLEKLSMLHGESMQKVAGPPPRRMHE